MLLGGLSARRRERQDEERQENAGHASTNTRSDPEERQPA
jgi:hypothetical protein